MRKRKGFTPLEKYCEGHYAQNADMCSFLKLPHKSKRKSLTGFTFIEVMIALILLMVGIVFLIDLFPLALKSFRNSKDVTLSTFILQEKMEEIRNMPFGQAVPQGSFLDAANPQYRYNIISGDWAYNDDYEEISVKVGKDKGRMIGKVYAQASTTRPKLPKGDMAVADVPGSTFNANNVLIFITKPEEPALYYSISMYYGGYHYTSNPWIKFPLPAGCIPDKVDVNISLANHPTGYVCSHYYNAFLYVTDAKNKQLWSNLLVIQPTGAGNYAVLGSVFGWVPLRTTLP